MDELVRVLGATDVAKTLEGQEHEILRVVEEAYVAYATGQCAMPRAVFLRFGQGTKNRIGALPAYVGGRFDVAGVKWISSFPGNLSRGLDRATGTLILNSTETGRAMAIMEASMINRARTAASAALAARTLHTRSVHTIAAIGCGVINWDTLRFTLRAFPNASKLLLFDLNRARAKSFEKQLTACVQLRVETVDELHKATRQSDIVSIATNATTPHIDGRDAFSEGTTVLHLSLRDLSPQLILSANNVVDDADHVCTENTSLHLAEETSNTRTFITASLPELLAAKRGFSRGVHDVVVFSPFGLGVLDVCVGHYVLARAVEMELGQLISYSPSKVAIL